MCLGGAVRAPAEQLTAEIAINRRGSDGVNIKTDISDFRNSLSFGPESSLGCNQLVESEKCLLHKSK